MKNTLFILLFSFLSSTSFPNGDASVKYVNLANLDSLWSMWNNKTQHDTFRLKAIHDFIYSGYLFSKPDSAFYFGGLEYDFAKTIGNKKWMAKALNTQGVSCATIGKYRKALDYYGKSLKIFDRIGDKKGMGSAYLNVGMVYKEQGEFKQALSYFGKSLKILEKIGDKSAIGNSYLNIGMVYKEQENYKKALLYYEKSLKIYEEIGEKSGMSASLGNMGIIYWIQGSFEQALSYYQNSLVIDEKINNKIRIADSYSNMGIVYKDQGNYKQAIFHYKKGLNIYKDIEDKSGMANSFNKMGHVYKEQQDNKNALSYLKKSLELYEELGDKSGMDVSISTMGDIYWRQGNYELSEECYKNSLKIREELNNNIGIASTYTHLASLYFEKNKYTQAFILGEKGLKIAQQVGALVKIKEASDLLYKLYKKTSYPDRALEMHELYIKMRDSVSSLEKKDADITLLYRHKFEKQQVIAEAKHQEQISLAAEREKRQQFIAYYTGIGLIVVLLFAIFIFKRLRVTRKQKNIIEEQKKDITDSINYAVNIQNSLLPTIENLKEVLPDGFVLFQPKDIVSGDFYWMQHHNNRVYFAACDCTGHGVPGAFMSMIGSSLLDEAVVEKGLTKPNEIFYEVRKGFIKALKQTGKSQKDGMDAALFAWDKGENLQISAAYNPVLIIKDKEIREVKPDRQPVGFHEDNQKAFTNNEIKLSKGDCVYIFSDGYPDQFGGPKQKKFMMKNFKKLLLSIQDKTMNEQKHILETTMAEWKGNTEQVDDIMVIGVRF